MDYVRPHEFDVTVTIDWKCPNCNHENHEEMSQGPYNAIAQDDWDVMCEECKEFYTVNFFAEGYDENGNRER